MDKASIVLISGSIAFLGGGVWLAMASTPAPRSMALTPATQAMTTTTLADIRPGDGPRAARGAPLSLTASDGTGLTLTSMVARAEVQDPLAFTELHLTFQNPQARQLEGTFRITLPRGASVSRFAMKIGGRWQEGEVVEKQAARVAYEDFLHRKQDPALLEQAGGNEFSARVFPIPPNGVKEIILSYSQELPERTPYSLPLQGLPQLGLVDVAVTEGGSMRPVQTFVERHFTPNGDFVLDAKVSKSNPGLRARNMVLAKIRAEGETSSDPVAGAIVLVDTSASRALGYADQVDLTASVLERIAQSSPAGGNGELRVAAFDQVVVPVFSGKGKDFGDKEIGALKARLPLGASNVERALAWAGEEAKKAGITRIILVGDGVATAGSSDGEAFSAVLGKLKENGVARIDAIAVGGIQDSGLLHRLVGGGLAHDGVVIDGSLGIANAVRRLNGATLSKTTVEVPGAKWFWPARLEGIQTGDEVTVYADVPEGQKFSVSVGGKPAVSPDLRSAEEPLLERAWVQARIVSLVDMEAKDPKPERVKEILDLSVNHRVLSPYTALLVLETEQDYARFKIDRKALKDILSMDTGQLTVKHRSWPFDEEPRGKELAKAGQKNDDGADKQGGMGTRAKGEEGSMGAASGSPDSPRLADSPPPAAPSLNDRRAEPEREMAEPPRSQAAGSAMPGASAGDAFGAGGLGLSGVGEGGGGRGEGIGLGSIGSVGHGAGTGSGQGFGSAAGRLGGSHQTQAPQLRQGATTVSGGLPVEVIQRIVRQNFGRFRLCYERGLQANPNLQGRVSIRFVIGKDGAVTSSTNGDSDLPDQDVVGCIVNAVKNLSFPQPENGAVTVTYPINFSPGDGSAGNDTSDSASPDGWNRNTVDPYDGKFKTVMTTLASKGAKAALETALVWHKEAPGDVLGLVALGEAYEADGAEVDAARAYGSLIDLFSARADLRRFAGERLEHVKEGFGLDLAIDTFGKAVAQRPDHPASHRLLAYARLRKGDLAGAFDAALNGAMRKYPEGRFAGVEQILREDLGLIGAAWIKKEPAKRADVMKHLQEARATLETGPSIRFVLNWETDANDVDFHIMDAKGGHAYYAHKALPSGGSLYEDVTTGYGPECFTIRKAKGQRSGPYKLQAHYYARGPMGYGMGKLEIIDHDGSGGLTIEERPYVVMVDHAFLDLGVVK
jgi:Vault protein inter-alpha-trypsin domain